MISGTIEGTVNAESRLELQATCRIEGEVYARRMQLEEGAILNGRVHMGEKKRPATVEAKRAEPAKGDTANSESSKAALPAKIGS